MPLKLPDVWSPVLRWLYLNSPAAVAAIIVAMARMVHEKNHEQAETAKEMMMCGIIAYMAIGWLAYLGIAPEQTGWIGAMVGYLGTKKTDRIAKVIAEKRGGSGG